MGWPLVPLLPVNGQAIEARGLLAAVRERAKEAQPGPNVAIRAWFESMDPSNSIGSFNSTARLAYITSVTCPRVNRKANTMTRRKYARGAL